MSKAPRRNRSVRAVVGSLGVLGVTAAVAGLGTFGTFTDSTTPVATTVASGTVDITLSAAGYALPASTADFVPGDSLTRAVTLSSTAASSPLSSVTLTTTATASSVLDTDTTHGLQLNVQRCSQAWAQHGDSSSPTYTCGGTVTDLGTTPVVGTRTLAGLSSLQPGGTDHLAVTISLPTSAGDAFQSQSSTLSLVVTGTQRAAATR